MANWCSNSVVFEGEQGQLTDLKILFDAMALKERKQRKGQLPDFVYEQEGFFFDCRWEDEVLFYETKWAPNTAVLMEIAVRLEVGFTHRYAEGSNQIYGEAVYQNNVFTDIRLDNDDFGEFSFNEENETYQFENKEYERKSEILEILLERKQAIQSL